MQELTWLKQFLSEVINFNSTASPHSRSVFMLLTVTIRWASIDLRWTSSGMAKAVYLPMRLLTESQMLEVRRLCFGRLHQTFEHRPSCKPRFPFHLLAAHLTTTLFSGVDARKSVRALPVLQVVLDMAQRAARAEGQEAPARLPDEAKQAWCHVYHMVGGVPRLLSFALKHMGWLGGLRMGQLQPHRAWNTGTLCFSLGHLVTALCPGSVQANSRATVSTTLTAVLTCRASHAPVGLEVDRGVLSRHRGQQHGLL